MEVSTKKLEGKIALATGGTKGMGRAIVERLASEGAKVAFNARGKEEGKKYEAELKKAGYETFFVQADITKSEDVSRLVRAVLDKYDRIDILVNNVGWDKGMPFTETTEDLWDQLIAVNFKGDLLVTKAVLDDMIKRGIGGKIVSISSDAGRVGSTNEAVYSGCKGGVIAFSKTLARELARYKINVNTICPGPTRTPFLEDFAAGNPKVIEAMSKGIPLRRIGEPEDIAAAVAFLVSNDADFITGQTLSVSGGLNMV